MSKSIDKDRVRKDAVELRFLEKVSSRLPEDTEILQALAEAYTNAGEFQNGLAIDLKLSHRIPRDNLVWYNLGCSFALTGRKDEAFEALAKAIELGYYDYDWMKGDTDLNGLHDDPRFESLLSWLYTVACEEE